MSNTHLEENPFNELFYNAIDIQLSVGEINVNLNMDQSLSNIQQSENSKTQYVNKIIERVFSFTINKECSFRNVIYLDKLALSSEIDYLNEENLGEAIFERLAMDDPEMFILNQTEQSCQYACEKYIIKYLYRCFEAVHDLKSSNSKVENINDTLLPTMNDSVVIYAATCLKQPDMFPIQEFGHQISDIICGESAVLAEQFLERVIEEFEKGNDDDDVFNQLKPPFTKVLQNLHTEITQSKLYNFKASYVRVLKLFTSNRHLARILLSYNAPRMNVGNAYSDTLIGSILSLSCLPKSQDGTYEFYDNPLKQAPNVTDCSIWNQIKLIHGAVYDVLRALLKCSPEVKSQTLTWLSDCIHANAGRGKLWNSFNNIKSKSSQFVSDAFMLNFESVLLRFCEPIYADNKLLLMIDPTYCAVTHNDDNMKLKNHHAKGLSSETCLIPVHENESKPEASKFGFVSECFFLTHKAIDIGFRVAYEKLVKQNQDLIEMKRVLREVKNQAGRNTEVYQNLSERMVSEMRKFLSLRAALSEPETLTLLAKLHVTTAKWLVQVALDTDNTDSNRSSYCPKSIRDVNFPLPQNVPKTLMCVPEFLIENIACFLSFSRHFSSLTLEEQGFDFLNPLLTMILVFMGFPERMSNPHLRARLAECLESILPHEEEKGTQITPNPLGHYCRERLFLEHPLRLQIIPNLLNVFVSIELTGQSVEFEQKFNYRRYMHKVMEYLWNIDEHQKCFINLAEEAEQNIHASNPPLFLRFINLLINDATFLLDEAFRNMAKLRKMEMEREAGNWKELSASDRRSNQNNFQRTGMIARSDNILGKETIHIFVTLTSKIKSIFCNSTMVDRIARMLNYFLLQLVGPKSIDLKVKNPKEYDFEPGNIVMDICRIYIHLGMNDAFCAAVSNDGRSYKPQLFRWARNVLKRIASSVSETELNTVAEKVAKFKTKDNDLTDIPEEFQDQLMFTLMRDPVILPSGHIVDRSTIAYHLLNYQNNPFSQLPLTMDMVKPHTELKTKIEEWMKEKKENQNEN